MISGPIEPKIRVLHHQQTVALIILVKLLWRMSREMAKKLKGLGKTLAEDSPMLMIGFYPPRALPWPIPFWNGTHGLIGWYP